MKENHKIALCGAFLVAGLMAVPKLLDYAGDTVAGLYGPEITASFAERKQDTGVVTHMVANGLMITSPMQSVETLRSNPALTRDCL